MGEGAKVIKSLTIPEVLEPSGVYSPPLLCEMVYVQEGVAVSAYDARTGVCIHNEVARGFDEALREWRFLVGEERDSLSRAIDDWEFLNRGGA